jgi:predicted AlkP superfamily pyrophosphatase or phosphodiesterase
MRSELLRKSFSTALVALLAASSTFPARADAYHASPKLVVILVIDQFRGDYLDRYRDDFKTPSGFNLFLKRGAYFTDCYYNYANTMTAPGHSTIGTGAYTAGHGIQLNQWWDTSRSQQHPVTSVEDERYEIVGDHTSADIGTSPRNEMASTLGDEVVMATRGASKLYGISLKDRAAILTSGHASNGAFWLDHASGHFVSSTYWGADLPQWVKTFNASGRTEQAAKEANARKGFFYDDAGASPASVSYLLDFAETLVASEKMGQRDTTDVLTISISSTDILGHKVGPDAPEQRAMIDAVDVDLDHFFTYLDKHVDGGLANVMIALTGDHGIGPTIAGAAASRMAAEQFNLPKVMDALEVGLNARFTPGEKITFLRDSELPYLTLDAETFSALKIPEETAEKAVAELLLKAFESSLPPVSGGVIRLPVRAALHAVYTKTDMRAGAVPATQEGKLVLNSYSPNGGWFVMLTPGMYAQASATGTNHYTPYSYDRHVPLAFFGAPFVTGIYHEAVEPVDIAATLASLLRVNRPSAAVGRVLTFALKPGQ